MGLAEEQPIFRLLVVEDNENNRNLLVKLLQSVGFEVEEAINGEEAIAKWQKWQPHLIWMDMHMPVMDGYQATKIIKSEMRQSTSGIDTKIIALTASVFERDHQKVVRHGGDDFVRKPFRETDIFGMLEKHLSVRFVYDEDGLSPKCGEGNGIAIEVLKSETSALPVEILTRLAEATELSDAAMIIQIIEDIRTHNSPLANGLSELAENFAYDKILALIKPVN
jgi:CheY-like chemotaxis protein